MNNSQNQFKRCALALSVSSILACSVGYAQAQEANTDEAQIEKILVRGVKGSQVASMRHVGSVGKYSMPTKS